MSVYSDLIIAQGANYYWKLDDVSGGAVDSVGGLNLTETGTPVYNQFGASGTSILTNSIDDGFISASTADMNFVATQDFSYSFWVRFNALVAPSGIVSKRVSSVSTCHFSAFLNTATHMFFDLGANQTRWDTNFTPNSNTWYHMVFTYNATTLEYIFYVNGVQNASTTAYVPTTQATNAPFHIGYLGGSPTAYSRGSVDEVAVFMNKLLSPAEVAAQYNTAFPFWRVFDGTSWKDADKRII